MTIQLIRVTVKIITMTEKYYLSVIIFRVATRGVYLNKNTQSLKFFAGKVFIWYATSSIC